MNEIVKYNNALHKNFDFNNLTETQSNVFFTILSRLKFANSTTLEITFQELFSLANINNNGDFRKEVLSKLRTLQTHTMTYQINEQGDLRQEVLFPVLETNTTDRVLKVQISETFKNAYLSTELGKFTKYELAEFVNLSGKYPKIIYRYLKQWRRDGKWEVDFKEFKDILGIPQSYLANNIDQRILKPCIKELSAERNLFDTARIPFKNLKIEKIKISNRIKKLVFTFTPENTDNKKTKAEKKAIADLNAENAERKFSQQFSGKKIKDNNDILWIIFSISQAENEKIIADMQRADDYNIRKNFNFDSLEKLKNLVEKYETENPKKERKEIKGLF